MRLKFIVYGGEAVGLFDFRVGEEGFDEALAVIERAVYGEIAHSHP